MARAALAVGAAAASAQAQAHAPPRGRAPAVDSAMRVHLDSLVEQAESYVVHETKVASADYWTARLANGAVFRALEEMPYVRNGTPAMLMCRTTADCRLWVFGEGTYVGVALTAPPAAEGRAGRWMTLDEVRGRGTVLMMMSGPMYAVPLESSVTRDWRRRSTVVVIDGRRAICLECGGPLRSVEVTPIR